MSCDLVIASDSIPRPTLDMQLRRYHRSYRRRLRKMAHSSGPLKDLVYSFPGAAFAIAGGISSSHQRAKATCLVREGANLCQIGNAIGLPGWTRRLPPEAYHEVIGPIPDGNGFSNHIVNTIPKDPQKCAHWLQWVSWSYRLCDGNFTLWIARQRFWDNICDKSNIILPLAAYAWYSQKEGTTACNLMEHRWTPNLGFAKAYHGASRWHMRCLYEYCNDDKRNAGRWFALQRVSGIRIVPLRTPIELADEGEKMGHCVADYTEYVLSGICLIYSIRRGNRHLATLEVRPRSLRDGNPRIIQLRGPHNAAVDEDVCHAVDIWLVRQGKYPFVTDGCFSQHPINPQRWQALWEPYLEFVGLGQQAIHPRPLKLALDRLATYR